MSSIFKRKRDRQRKGSSWYVAYVDATGVRRTVRGCPDRTATEAMARTLESEAELRRRGVIDPRTDAYATHEARPLADHVADFRRSLEAKGGTRKHALVTAHRAERVLTLAKARRISDLSLSKALDALAVLRDEGLGAETINHHVRAAKGFSRWLWRDGRAREHALAHLATSNPEADRRRQRRALTPEESGRLIQTAELSPIVMGMTGPDRAMAYAVALGTGLRADEIRALTPERFDLSGDPPTATVPSGYTKNKHEAIQPLPSTLADRLRLWLSKKPPGRPVFDLPDRTAEMIRVDLEAAGIASETASGVIDFHALRATYISHLVSSGASVKTCQVLARHSTAALTIGIYAKASLHDIKEAVDALPDLTPTAPKPEAVAATGTDGGSALTALCQRSGDGTGRNLSATVASDDVNSELQAVISMDRNPLEPSGLDAQCRMLTAPVASAGGGIRTHMGVAPRRILSPLRLPFRHAGLNATLSCSSPLMGVKRRSGSMEAIAAGRDRSTGLRRRGFPRHRGVGRKYEPGEKRVRGEPHRGSEAGFGRGGGRLPGRSGHRVAVQTRSLSAFRGIALTTLRAGLALIVIGSPVNGLVPFFSLVAGLCTTLSFRRPGMINRPGPFLPSSLPINSPSEAKTTAICFLLSPVFSPRTV